MMKKAYARFWLRDGRVWLRDERHGHPDDFPEYPGPLTWALREPFALMEAEE